MASIFDWSATAASNTTCDGINCNTGMSPANTDNLIRSLMALIRNTFASALQNFLAGTAALPIANGGTGAATASAACTALGALEDDYKALIVTNKAAAFAAANESGVAYNYLGAAAAMTLNPQSTTAIDLGATFVVRNGGSGAITVTRGSGVTLVKNGATSSADATIAVGGIATLIYWGSDYWTINGVGVS